jgi:hypothetical protein
MTTTQHNDNDNETNERQRQEARMGPQASVGASPEEHEDGMPTVGPRPRCLHGTVKDTEVEAEQDLASSPTTTRQTMEELVAKQTSNSLQASLQNIFKNTPEYQPAA